MNGSQSEIDPFIRQCGQAMLLYVGLATIVLGGGLVLSFGGILSSVPGADWFVRGGGAFFSVLAAMPVKQFLHFHQKRAALVSLKTKRDNLILEKEELNGDDLQEHDQKIKNIDDLIMDQINKAMQPPQKLWDILPRRGSR